MHLQVFEGRQVVVQFSHAQLRRDIASNPPSNTLFIGNVAYELTDRDIQAIFADVKKSLIFGSPSIDDLARRVDSVMQSS